MTTKGKIARRKLSLLELANEMSNVSKACRSMGYSRQQFYEFRRNYQTYGAEGLIDRLPGARGPHSNRVSEEVEAAVLAHALAHPAHGALRVAQELSLKGVQVSAGGVRGVCDPSALVPKPPTKRPATRVWCGTLRSTGPRRPKPRRFRLVEFETHWGERYSALAPVWRRTWKHVVLMFAFPSAIRKISIHGLTQQQCLPTVIKGSI